MPKVTIVIPTYNSAKYILGAIESVLNQTYQDFEIIIVDDGSTDDTEDIVQRYIKQNPDKIKYFYQVNSGAGAARNKGIKETRGKLICFLDSDDFYTPDSLQLRMEASDLYDADIIIGKRRKLYLAESRGFVDDNFIRKYRQAILRKCGKTYLCNGSTFFNLALSKGLFVDTNSIMFKKKFLLDLGLFDKELRISQDIDLWFRAFFNVKKFVFIDEVLSVTRHYLNRHAKDLNKLFSYERRRYLKQIKLLNQHNFDKNLIKILKKRLCAKKYKIKGILTYRNGDNIKALKHYIKSLVINRDREIVSLIFKALIPRVILCNLKSIKMALSGAK